MIIRNDPAGFDAAEDRTGTGVGRLRAVIVLVAVVNLHFVSVRRCLFGPLHRPEEVAGVQFVAMRDRLGLEDEVAVRPLGLQEAGPVLDTDDALFDGEFAL